MSLEFLAPDAVTAFNGSAPLARSPMERDTRAAGARFEARDGWNVAVSYGVPDDEAGVASRTAGWADVSHLGKLEVQAGADDLAAIVRDVTGGARLDFGRATRALDAWWCPLTAERAVVICEPAALPVLRQRLEEAAEAARQRASIVEVTSVFAAMTIVGPLSREVFARFCALDLRPQALPIGGLRPGSIARQPGLLVHEAQDRFLFLFGWAVAHYMWTVVDDAGRHLGGIPIGVDALGVVEAPEPEVSRA